MADTVLISLTREELRGMIEEVVQQVFGSHQVGHVGNEDDYFNLEDAAHFLKLAPQTLYGLTSRREIPYIKKRRRLMFVKKELEAWLQEGRRRTVHQIRTSD